MTATERGIHRGLLIATSCAGMFVFGIVMALLGAVLPTVSARFQFDLRATGALFLAMNFAMLVCSLVLGVAMDRYGMKPALAAGPLLVALALELIARAAGYGHLLASVVLLGIGGGALNGSTNTLTADLHDDPQRKSSALNLLGVFFGFGALFLPFGIGALLGRAGLAAILHAAAAVCAAVGVIAAGLRFPPAKQRRSLPLSEVPRFLQMPLVLAMAFLLFFESGNEFILGGYLSTFLTRELAASVAAASWLLALFWASIMAARVMLSRLLLKAGGHQVVLCSAVAAAAGAALIALSRTLGVAAAGIALAGFSLAGIFPTVLGMAGARFREHSGTVFGILFTVALTGGMTLPWLSGQLAQAASLRWVPALVAADFLAIILLECAAARQTAD